MGKPSPPTPPDPKVTVPEQTKSNIQTATAQAGLDAVNSVSPYGSVKYDITGHQNIGGNDVPQYTQTTTLSPEQQGLYSSLTGVEQSALDTARTGVGNVQNTLSQPFSLGGINPLQTSVNTGKAPLYGINTGNLPSVPLTANDFAAQGKQAQDAVMSRFNEDFPKRQEDLNSRLNAEGLQAGSAAWNDQQNTLQRSRNDALAQAILAGNNVQNNMFGQAMASRGQVFGEDQAQAGQYNAAQGQEFAQGQSNATLANQSRQQGVTEAQLMRNQPTNELATLLGLGGNIQTPTAAPNFGVNVNPTDVLGAYGQQMQGQMNNYNQKMQANSALWDALIGAGGTAAKGWIMSDARMKNIIRRIGETEAGIPLYLYTYKGSDDPQIGVMAQEAAEYIPHAVKTIDGVLHVNYGEVM